jgi:CheY-like chemotaxis protein
MPVMDGLASTREIRRFEKENNLRPTTVIALTGLASAGIQQEAVDSGVTLFLAKPVRLEELNQILLSFLTPTN